MWMVFDLDAKPTADRSSNDDGEPVIHVLIADAIKDLGERIRFSLGYANDPDGTEPAPPLPIDISVELARFEQDFWDWPGKSNYLRHDTADGYAHIIVRVSDFAGPGFHTSEVSL